MKKVLSVVCFFHLISFSGTAQSSEFNQPWNDSSKAIIIDPYCENPIDWGKLIMDKRVAAIIHKATQGESIDCKYAERKALAKENALLWGSYHMGMAGDPIKQANFYLSVTKNDSSELMALDLESLDSTKFMSLKNAERFVAQIYAKTGRYPFIYCNNAVLEGISLNYSDTSIFSKCGLWYARFVKELPALNKKVWNTYSLWQFSCEINCKKTGNCWYNVPGTAFDMDVNVYNGTVEELNNSWPAISKSVLPEKESWLSSFDLDGDKIKDQITFDFSGGAHCCYTMNILLSSLKKEYKLPFNMDGGYLMGVDDSQPDKFAILNMDDDSLPEIKMTIETYNGEESPLPLSFRLEYGIKTNYIIIQYENGALKVRDQKK
ncbi:MAG TPA: glycoside hydrolase family 25 protein [Bacteroidia bacterium]|jgi:GH25 family lysozyme M1 (1,4-beta-N-acetylmuramidase)